MKTLNILLICLLSTASAWSQINVVAPDTIQGRIEYVDDEACGCELVFIDGIQTTTDGERYGFKRQDGTIITNNIYYTVERFRGNYCKVLMAPDSVGMIDRDGNEVIPCIYTDVEYPTDGRFRVLQGIHYGFCDLNGKEVVKPTYRAASTFQEGLAVVAFDFDSFRTEYGFIDTLGAIVLAPRYEYAFPFSEGYAVVKMYDRYGMIDRQGREVVTAKYMTLTSMSHGIYFAGDDVTIALYNSRHERLTEPVYIGLEGLREGRILVRRNSGYGYLDTLGHEVIPCQYAQAGLFNQGRAWVVRNGRYGIIDTAGRIVLPIEYSHQDHHFDAYEYREGLAMVERNGLCGFADLTGRIAIPIIYRSAYPFAYGLAPVQSASTGLWGYIDTTGRLIVPHLFSTASPFRYGRAEVGDINGLHHMDTEGRCVKNCKNSPRSWKQ